MSSELLRLLVENANRFGFVDVVLLVVAAVSVATSATIVIHWIYKHALEKQDHVIASQDKLIALKDKTVAEYEQFIERLGAEKARADDQLTETSKQLGELNKQIAAQNREAGQKEGHLLLYAAAQRIGVLTARNIFFRLELCSSMRYLIRVYAAVTEQHDDRSGPATGRLLEEVDAAEGYFLQRVSALDTLDKVSILTSCDGVPEPLLSSADDHNIRQRTTKLEEFVVANTLPILQRYETRVRVASRKFLQEAKEILEPISKSLNYEFGHLQS